MRPTANFLLAFYKCLCYNSPVMKKNAFFIFTAACLSLALMSCNSTKQASAPEAAVAEAENNLEYQRSTNKIEGQMVSRETFNADKSAILKKIAELNEIMAKKDYNSWLRYIDPASKNYWSNSYTLLKASEKLPKESKGIKLRNLNDYFNYVFIPSRKGRQIDEIRYNSAKSVKAVQISEIEEGKTKATVYYNFIKIDDDWKVELPNL